tara:strand:- start:334 stop:528 length:195 start_codon:yes stop_codon:yes gene_type:complete
MMSDDELPSGNVSLELEELKELEEEYEEVWEKNKPSCLFLHRELLDVFNAKHVYTALFVARVTL